MTNIASVSPHLISLTAQMVMISLSKGLRRHLEKTFCVLALKLVNNAYSKNNPWIVTNINNKNAE